MSLNLVREGIECLRAAGWPPSFIMMYDEAWLIMHAVSEIMVKGVALTHACPRAVSGVARPGRGHCQPAQQGHSECIN